MPSPFPGMDPYLEHPALWPDVHNQLISELRGILVPLLRPRYIVRIEERTYLDPDGLALVSRPDLSVRGVHEGKPRRGVPASTSLAGLRTVEVQLPVSDRARESYIEVRTAAGGEVITVIEVLSPANKTPGRGRRVYEAKRRLILDSLTHLVEIDLLRGGERMPVSGVTADAHYRVLISRSEHRPRAELLLFSVRDLMPSFELPLRGDERGPALDLRAALGRAYDSAGYDLSIDYRGDPVPPLDEADGAWAHEALRQAGLRV